MFNGSILTLFTTASTANDGKARHSITENGQA